MNLYQVKICPTSDYQTRWKAYQLFGAMCWAISCSEGTDALGDFLSMYIAGTPPIVLSNGFPGDLLPRPHIPQPRLPRRLPKADAVRLMATYKDSKRISLLNLEEFNSLVSGEPVSLHRPDCVPEVEVVVYHNQIDRVTGSSLGESGLYPQISSFLAHPSGYISIYALIAPDWLERFTRWLQIAGEVGIGGRKSTGKGRFTVKCIREFNGFRKPKEANAYVALSDYVPASGDPSKGFYRIATVYGRIGGRLASDGSVFKSPVFTLTAGSVMLVEGNIRPYYGRVVPGVSPSHPQVFHYGLTPAVPATIGGTM